MKKYLLLILLAGKNSAALTPEQYNLKRIEWETRKKLRFPVVEDWQEYYDICHSELQNEADPENCSLDYDMLYEKL